jgi:PAS domain S-box-containing protein
VIQEDDFIMLDDLKSLTILLCDDDVDFLETTQILLSRKVAKVIIAKDGQEALELFNIHKSDIDAMIVDIQMPRLSGIELCKKIRDNNSDIDIILLTGHSNLDLKDIARLKISKILTKPIPFEILLNMLKEIATVKNDAIHQKELQELINLTDEYIYISKTDKHGIINYVSKAFCDVSGYTKEELIGNSHRLIRHSDMPKEAFEDMWNTISIGNRWQGEVKNRKKDGGYYWVEATVSPIFDNEDNIIGYKSIRVDITDKKELQSLNSELELRVQKKVESLRQKDEMLQAQSRNALMGEMISMIAHQWRQPLSTISLLVNDINMKFMMNAVDENYLKESINKTNQTIHYMSKTIDDFREFFKPNKEKEYVYIEKSVQNAISFIEPLIKKYEIELNINIISDNKIVVYKNELLQVLINIIKNAIDASVEKNIPKPKITIVIDDVDNTKIINIIDNAGGVPQELRDKIFEPYFSTKKKNGTGLGLYMSKIIIEEHLLGSLGVRNYEDGAIFTIEIPFSSQM